MISGYATLITWLKGKESQGCIVEIGAFDGDGTAQLAREYPERAIVSVDAFDPTLDKTATSDGLAMRKIYADVLAGRDQRAVFDENTKNCPNVVCVPRHSLRADLPHAVWLATIDGGHDPRQVAGDFWRMYGRATWIACHDYSKDTPEVMAMLDWIRAALGCRMDVVDDWAIFRGER